ncbi:hypothetical protein OSB04_021634 [Centaurea solstitialis]|uniref:Ninja-family protein n=1 Tax=Centaurea solstitialis TaxID=347529 RepID=A0AA38T7Y5_9ASTR|nr:hypothetical protein OSB04_021634 [Centaurea solstitialis]
MAEKTSNEMMENLSIQTKSRFPRDLLHRFSTTDVGAPRRSDPEEDPGSVSGDEVELNLGLSLGGRFGVDKSNNSNKLIRSSSIAAILPVVKDDDVLGGGGGGGGQERRRCRWRREEQWRKRKELQSLRRLAAKRRRSEKQRSLTKGERDDYVAAMGRVGSSAGPAFRSSKWASDAYSSGGGSGLGSQPSPESQGSVSEFETRHHHHHHRQGSSGSGGETSSLQEQKSQEAATGSTPPKAESPAKKQGKEIGACSIEEMPCVFTQGDGPNGRVIEGILYKYGRGEQVKIMCVCHGSFLSPAEFVKHAGGTDVDHPLKHIVVKPSPAFS